VSVSDTGVGLPPQQDQIFPAFFTTKLHGTGTYQARGTSMTPRSPTVSIGATKNHKTHARFPLYQGVIALLR
jgi:hypothetical protein